jgi:phytoene desaturase
MSDVKRVGIIGGGLGGLSLAVKLQNEGYKVSLFERHSELGGVAQSFQEKDYYLEAGPTLWTQRDVIDALLKDAGLARKITWLPLDPLFHLMWKDNLSMDLSVDVDKMRTQIEQKFPEELLSFDKFIKLAHDNYEKGFLKFSQRAFLNAFSGMRRWTFQMRSCSTPNAFAFAQKCFKDKRLQEAFSFLTFLSSGSPFFAVPSLFPYASTLVEEKFFYPRGGSRAVVDALAEALKKAGGKIYLSTPVAEVFTEAGHIKSLKTTDGHIHEFEIIASNIDPLLTYKEFLKGEDRTRKMQKQWPEPQYGPSFFALLLGVKKKFPKLAANNIWLGERYRDYFTDIDVHGILPRDIFCTVHIPSRIDEKLAPSGCETISVYAPVPHMDRLCLDWEVEGPKYARRLVEYLDQTMMPGIQQSIVVQKIISPEDLQKQFAMPYGSVHSLRPTLLQSFQHRPQNRDRKIRGLYFVGAGTHPGPGVQNVLKSSQITFGLIQKDFTQA